MATIYGYKRFNYPEAMRVNLSAKANVTDAAVAAGNPDYDTVNGLGRNDVGCVIKVTNTAGVLTGEVLADKSEINLAAGTYYVLSEVPMAADSSDFYFVGVIIKSQYDVDNLIERTTQLPWADQFYHLRTRGVR